MLCEQPDGTALPQPDLPVTNVMPRNTSAGSHAGTLAQLRHLQQRSGAQLVHRAVYLMPIWQCNAIVSRASAVSFTV